MCGLDLDRFRPPGPRDEPKQVGECAHCGGELYADEWVTRTTEGEIVHDECTDAFLRDRYVSDSGIIDEYGRLT
jgi:hypothetical protein